MQNLVRLLFPLAIFSIGYQFGRWSADADRKFDSHDDNAGYKPARVVPVTDDEPETLDAEVVEPSSDETEE